MKYDGSIWTFLIMSMYLSVDIPETFRGKSEECPKNKNRKFHGFSQNSIFAPKMTRYKFWSNSFILYIHSQTRKKLRCPMDCPWTVRDFVPWAYIHNINIINIYKYILIYMVILTGFLCICGYVDKFVEKIRKILKNIFTN